MFEVYQVPNDELDGSEEFIEGFERKSDALEFAENERTISSDSVWVI